MYDLNTILGRHQNRTYLEDEYGQYGSVFASDDDRDVPSPLDFNPNPRLFDITRLPQAPPVKT